MQRLSVQVRGIVQGVGFRPFAAGLCRRFNLTGAARNTPRGLDIEIQGAPRNTDAFLAELHERPPALARIAAVSTSAISIVPGESGFRILHSLCAGPAHTPVAPEASTCAACLAEMRDPADRRHRYPFLNCTCCGPRFTITERVPYDRAHTTMKRFPMCPACESEYNNPEDRRFHAQPTACPDCGPQLDLCDACGAHIASSQDALDRAVRMLLDGKILAIKGLGGFHIACRAQDPAAVSRLRKAKTREHKPFAVMVRDTDQARTFCRITPHEDRFLNDHTRPILLLDKIGDSPNALPRDTAPARITHGVMLPYTPLHHLLLGDMDEPLIMTSANRRDEPIAFGDEEAFKQLGGIADAFLTHNRPIHMRCDDSVARVWRGRLRVLRRARGFAPAPLPLPIEASLPILACGPDLKNTFALARNDECILSHHIGDLHHPECLASYEQAIPHYENLFGFAPRAMSCDMHPDYHSTAYAQSRARGIPLVAVQHHHAHIAACLADNGARGPVIGVAFDGTGYGPDNTVWGGEFLIADLSGFTRAAHLACAPLPGGDAAARQPWRMAASHLLRALGPDFRTRRLAFNDHLHDSEWNMIQQMIERGLNAPLTSSMGRLFDAVSALCGFTH